MAEADDPLHHARRRRSNERTHPSDRADRAGRAPRAGRRGRPLLRSSARASRSARAAGSARTSCSTATRASAGATGSSTSLARRAAAGQEIRRRAHRGRDRRRQHHPRVLHHQPRHRAGRRRDAPRRRQLDHGLLHIAHDCQVGNHTIFANSAQLAGHVTSATGRSSAASPACTSSCTSAPTASPASAPHLTQDLPPYVTAAGDTAQALRHQRRGLKRRGFTAGGARRAQARLQDALSQRPDAGRGEARARGAGRRVRRKCGARRFPQPLDARHRA